MNKKTEHPFLVPDNFFEEFKSEFLSNVRFNNTASPQFQIKKLAINTFKYAAIVAIAFLLGRYSMIISGNQESDLKNLDLIINQVSEEEIVDFVIEDEILNEL